jgi:hypothetical protein
MKNTINNRFAFEMKAGTIEDLAKVVGWCFSRSTGRMWIERPIDRSAAGRIRRSGNFAWARPYILDNGQRVVLA